MHGTEEIKEIRRYRLEWIDVVNHSANVDGCRLKLFVVILYRKNRLFYALKYSVIVPSV